MAILRMDCDMDQALRLGQKVPGTKANGSGTKLMDKGSFGMQMVTFMMDNGQKTKQMAMGRTFTLMALSIKDIGKMT